MARKVFEVLINGEVVATKYAFNTARREIPTAIREMSNVGDVWKMTEENQTKEFNLRTGTIMKWVRESDGAEIIAEVRS